MTDQNKDNTEKPDEGSDIGKEQIREITRLLIESFPKLEEIYTNLKKEENRTPEEDLILKKIEERFIDILNIVDTLKGFYGDNIMKQATGIYYHIKAKANEGDEDAIKAIKELKPLYEASLNEGISNN